ncbi:hypothetical protein [Myxococcus landrumensis]|uniref:Lipoprotein n=1 Tax=Myxococcus landrumensis TaxID=2813577 RepID=A0ABX7N6U3_9BACT|nr:hypothetical protein [Myxococcus landrumus]QSQ12068.1 hypothetical protein JY572_27265 [Myxococcus landrumus]
MRPPPKQNGALVAFIVAGVVVAGGLAGGVVMLVTSPEPTTPPRRPAQAVLVPVPVPVPVPTKVPPVEAPPKGVEKPAPPRPKPLPKNNEDWGAIMLAKHLKKYDYCGNEAILRDGGIPRSYTLRARFDAGGQGVMAKVTPESVAMLAPCMENATKYIYLGEPPEKREFAVELTLSFAHLKPKGKPATHDDQWGIRPDGSRRD